MAQEYANKQPQGFKNYVEKIAVVGAGGQVGKFIVEELLKTGKHRITAITREDSTSKFPASVEVKKVNYDDQSSLVEAFQGQEVLLITMAVTAPPGQETKLVEAAAAANVPWILPNEWGMDSTSEQLGKDVFIGVPRVKNRAHIEQLGKSSWIGIACSFWYEYSLSSHPAMYGFDFPKRTVTFFDDGKTAIHTSTWPQCGRAVANLLSLKVLPDDDNDKTLHLSKFKNEFVLMSSFTVSQRDMLDSVLRVTGASENDWKIDHEDVKERYKAGIQEFQGGNRLGFAKLLYSRVFFPDGSGQFYGKALKNDDLGLPKEDLDEYTKIAIEMAEKNGAMGGH